MGTDVLVARRLGRIARYVLGASALVLVGSIAFGIPILTRITAVASGYFAKQLCSEVFVAGRAATTVVETDLRYFFPGFAIWTARWSIDADAGIVRASFLGLGPRAARFRAGAGCALDAFDPGTQTKYRADYGANTQPIVNASSGATAMSPAALLAVRWEIAPAPNDRLQAIVANAFIERSEQPSEQSRTRAIIVLHAGRLIAERYADGFDAASRFPGWSIAKSMTHAMVGVLVAEGVLKLDDPISLPEWKSDGRRSVTWDQMLRMTSGLAFDESYANPLSDVNHMLWLAADAGKFAAALPLTSPPGVMWRYTSGTTNILTRAIRGVLRDSGGREDHPSWRAMFDRIGMTSTLMERDASGNVVGSSFVYATARDYARFGWLYAMDGIWEGDRVLPPGWVRHAMQPTAGSMGRYGAHFWLEAPPHEKHHFKDAPPTMLNASGFAGQWISILPSEQLVIVRLGQSVSRTGWNQWAFIAAVREAIGQREDSAR
ncbi:MAG: serine hydrolase domain-containing protein [Burkholderiales bacterium]